MNHLKGKRDNYFWILCVQAALRPLTSNQQVNLEVIKQKIILCVYQVPSVLMTVY